jgi:hypothetical protein
MRVRIVAIPPGEAPEEVRRSWVGLSLPVATQFPGPVPMPYYGVLTGPRTRLGHIWRLVTGRAAIHKPCYVVLVDDALVELTASAPTAADWWRENTPDLIGVGLVFGFPIEVCQLEAQSSAAPDPS